MQAPCGVGNSEVIFPCSNCAQPLLVEERARGSDVICPTCGAVVTVPEREKSPRASLTIAGGVVGAVALAASIAGGVWLLRTPPSPGNSMPAPPPAETLLPAESPPEATRVRASAVAPAPDEGGAPSLLSKHVVAPLFEVDFPAVPELTSTANTNATSYIAQVRLAAPAGLILEAHWDNGMPGTNSSGVVARLAHDLDRLSGNSFGLALLSDTSQMLSHKGIELGPHPGEEYVVRVSSNLFVHGRCYLIDRHLVDFAVAAPSEAALTSSAAADFLASVKLRKNEER